jgi:2,4-dienoyl-CoA reductase-like NADH-dependent reductase (Old Yellow Enzyme family)
MDSLLFSEFNFNNGVKVKNRLALSPMTNSQSHENGLLGGAEYSWLLSCAQGGFGIINTCAAYISPTAKAWSGQLAISDDAQIPALQKLTKDLNAQGSIAIMQIFHGGVRCPSSLTLQQPVSASEYELSFPGFEKPRALSKIEIYQIIQDFADATERAYQAGFQGVEIHGANGYLITQFISTSTNFRNDEYGRTLEGRALFVREIVRACRERVPTSFLLGIRILAEGIGLDLDENIQIAKWLVQDGIDFLDLSLGNGLAAPKKYADTSKKTTTAYFRESLGDQFPIIAGGKVQTAKQAELVIEEGANFVSLGRIAIGNSHWPRLINSKDFEPVLPPYTEKYLKKIGISEQFIGYLHTLPQGFAIK